MASALRRAVCMASPRGLHWFFAPMDTVAVKRQVVRLLRADLPCPAGPPSFVAEGKGVLHFLYTF
jgi:hypothetical protein